MLSHTGKNYRPVNGISGCDLATRRKGWEKWNGHNY